jgi:DNA-binding NarL/FixJ family response regulator
VVVTDKTVSRRHAELEICDGFANVFDLGSQNGIYVNHERVAISARVEPGQLIQFAGAAYLLSAWPREPADPDIETDDVAPPARAIREDLAKLLTPAQLAVATAIAEGLTEKQIAEKLVNSTATVHTHVKRIYENLDVHSHSALLAKLWKTKGD